MNVLIRVFAVLILFGATTCWAGQAQSLHIHMLSGSGEYKSDVSLPKWAELLRKAGHTCTIATGVTDDEDVANIDKCDLLVVFCKRWKLADEPLERVKSVATKKPVIGIRTASHAFQTWLAFDNEVMGGTYSGHGGKGEVTIALEKENRDHPVLGGIEDGWKREGKVYYNPPVSSGKKGAPKGKFKEDNIVLMRVADKTGKWTPATWIRENPNGQRVFYTSMGFVHDFEDERFLRLLSNAIQWTTEVNRSE